MAAQSKVMYVIKWNRHKWKTDSGWESNPRLLAWAASILPLSYDHHQPPQFSICSGQRIVWVTVLRLLTVSTEDSCHVLEKRSALNLYLPLILGLKCIVSFPGCSLCPFCWSARDSLGMRLRDSGVAGLNLGKLPDCFSYERPGYKARVWGYMVDTPGYTGLY